jgi:hypothetical protein
VTVNVPTIAKPWIAQWYGKSPAVFMAMGLLDAPGAILPVSKAPASAVAVWGSESALRQTTVWPTFTVTGFGAYELLPFMPTMEIVTSAATTGPGAGAGDVVAGVGDAGLL